MATSEELLEQARNRRKDYYARQFPTQAAANTSQNGVIPPVQTRMLGAPTHMAPVQTRLLGNFQKTDMSAPSAMQRNDKAAGGEYAQASRVLSRLMRRGPLAQRANAAMTLTDFRRNANNQGFNPGGIMSHEEEAKTTTGRIQARQQTKEDMGLFARRDRLKSQRYLDNPGAAGGGVTPAQFAPVSTAGLTPISPTTTQTQQEADFNSLTTPGSATFNQYEIDVPENFGGVPLASDTSPAVGDSLLTKKLYGRRSKEYGGLLA